MSLAVLQILVGLSGTAGGAILIASPDGSLFGFSTDWLVTSPFSNYLIPGIFLLIFIGVASDLAGVLTLLKRGYPGEIAVLLGAILMLWIVLQVWWVGLTHILQPIYFGLGFLELTLGLMLRREMAESQR